MDAPAWKALDIIIRAGQMNSTPGSIWSALDPLQSENMQHTILASL